MSAVILSEEMHETLLIAKKKATKEHLLKEHKANNLGWLYIPYHNLAYLTYEELEKALDGNYIIPKRGDYVTNKETGEVGRFGHINHRRRKVYILDHEITGFDPENTRLSTDEEIKEYAEKEIKATLWWLKSRNHGYDPIESKVEFDGNEAILTVRMVKALEGESE